VRLLHPSVVALGLAEIVSLTGTRFSMVAIPWLVLTTTGDPILTGLAGLAEMLPYVVVKALAGPLLDRFGARRISLGGDTAALAVVALVPILHGLGLLAFATLLPIVMLLGALRGPADAAKQAMVPAVAASAGLPLERVTGVMGTVERLASAIGLALAGGVVAALGPAPAIAVTAMTFGLAALIVRQRLAGIGLPGVAAPAGYLAELREGWRWFRHDAVLVGLAAMIAATNLLDQAYATVLLPVWASRAGDAALLGLLLALFSAAAVLGAGLATLFAERLPRLLVYTLAFLVTGAPRFAVFALDAPGMMIVAVLAAAGFASGFLNPIISAVMFERIPPALVGRVTALVNAMCWTLIPFGGLVGGALIALVGLPLAFASAGGLYLAATLLPLALPGFRDFARRPAAAIVN
jgi:MFS family permease